eukprot:gene8955-1293_t
MAHQEESSSVPTLESDDPREALDALFEISQILNTGLDQETLLLCVKLCNSGVNPEALAGVIQYLRQEAARMANVCESGFFFQLSFSYVNKSDKGRVDPRYETA